MEYTTTEVEALKGIMDSIQNNASVARKFIRTTGSERSIDAVRYKVQQLRIDSTLRADYVPKILIYDLETSQAEFRFKRFWTGKLNMYLTTKHMIRDPQIILVAYKWFGENGVKYIPWEKKSSESLIKEFVKIYNSADMIVGINNKSFDDRWVNDQAILYDLDINLKPRSLDVQRRLKNIARSPGYSMEYLCKKYGIVQKLSHRGIDMWNDIEDSEENTKIYKDAMKEMIKYGCGDIVCTEELLIRLWKYMDMPTNMAALVGGDRCDCPNCASTRFNHVRVSFTAKGMTQHLMKCTNCKHQYKVSNRVYLNSLAG